MEDPIVRFSILVMDTARKFFAFGIKKQVENSKWMDFPAVLKVA